MSLVPPERTRAASPRDAASLILVDRSGRVPKVLMGRRHHGHVFMPGFMVFPGGRVEAADRSMRVYGSLAPHTERNLLARVSRPSPGKARALALCAIRETFEETGLLLGETGLGAPPATSAPWRAFAAREVYPAPEALHFVARAITPPRHPRRFDTRFFVADAANIAGRTDGVIGPDTELVELKWLGFDETQDENLADITRKILSEVVRRLAEGLERDLPVPLFHERRGTWRRDEI
ncbi:NUDIX hydrolase [Labrys monachus]|uniref:8-oxo-dGTP pyrophosphatase MutT (NUDIX family) n=1 Tax=Labrys monachus TaxID=217067 RepID=A0ABU0FEL2_9HYPH|nr:NUDIX domain-containing protein [Labrys monachus]MDQ0393058.1 8-oxo-dGTP pyrophosphatase MutT (NUDIX family) [Labrys monachus]